MTSLMKHYSYFSILLYFVNCEMYLHSDYLYLQLAPSSLRGDMMGVFATQNIPSSTILCEYRGFLVPKELYEKNWQTLSFEVFAPDGQKIILVADPDDDSVCRHIKDSSIVHENYDYDDVAMLARNEAALPTALGKSHNAFIQIIGMKVFITSLRNITAGEEIFYSFGSPFWASFIEGLKNSVKNDSPSSASLYTVPNGGVTDSVRSDNYLLYTALSSLGNYVGLGVFANRFIPKGTILCEYRGVISNPTDVDVQSDYGFSVATFEGRHMVVTAVPGAHSTAMYINDCVSTFAEYTQEEMKQSALNLSLLPGCVYNAETQMDRSKAFVVSTRDIGPKEEIFISYGRQYWIGRLKVKDS